MKTRIRALLVVLAFTGRSAAAQSPRVERQLIAARDTVWRAWFANDTVILHRFIPSSAAVAEGAGKLQWDDRAKILAGAKAFAASGSRLERIDFAATEIDASGSSAFVRSYFRYVVRTGTRADTMRGRAAELFVRDGDRWVNPFWHLEFDTPGSPLSRTVELPDALGANVTLADSANAMGSATDYDALIGVWEFRFQSRQPNGSYGPAFSGHWTFEKKPGDGIIEDHWRRDDPNSPMGVSLYTYRIFDPDKRIWRIIGAWSGGGSLTPGVTWAAGDNRMGYETANGGITRFRYFDLGPNHFLWRADRSTDGGKTWVLDASVMEARRIGK